jgi:hypothetical protein
MNSRLLRAFSLLGVAPLLIAACGGLTASSPSDGRPSSDGGGSSGASSSGGSSGGGPGAGATCVSIDVSTYDSSCQQASDCVYVAAGEVCSDTCDCPSALIDSAEVGRYDQAVASVLSANGVSPGELCPCPAELEPLCMDSRCFVPGFGPEDAAPPPDAPGCVDVDPTTYDTSCAVDSDCIDVATGVLCADYCPCGGTLINVAGQARYWAAVAPVVTGQCGCVAEGVARCVQGECIRCAYTATPTQECDKVP